MYVALRVVVLRLVMTLELLASEAYQWVACGYHTISVAQSMLSTVVSKVLQDLETKLLYPLLLLLYFLFFRWWIPPGTLADDALSKFGESPKENTTKFIPKFPLGESALVAGIFYRKSGRSGIAQKN
ncbi:uncharacterized protein LOC119637567 [Glossina fuscipes]|uniref:Uncharacterized protein LOC119637567 n=1 Tax=Glossina fuscipes TaxID=7396 RepID=A0A9C5Z8A8_9MUSC|nr:uncharacterized protein LOC119637567 [Glossina fuscipes]